jgi:hypothetical protein
LRANAKTALYGRQVVVNGPVTVIIESVADFSDRALEWVARLDLPVDAAGEALRADAETALYGRQVVVYFAVAVVVLSVANFSDRSFEWVAGLDLPVEAAGEALRADAESTFYGRQVVVYFAVAVAINTVAQLVYSAFHGVTGLRFSFLTARRRMLAGS